MQRLNMLQGYQRLAEATGAVFQQPVDNADQSRLVKFRIITERDVVLKVSDCAFDPETGEVGELGEPRLLTVVKAGYDEVEFNYLGTFQLDFMGASEIWLDTFDNAFVSTEPSDLTNYARLWEREERDPRILEIEQAARHNEQRLKAEMLADRMLYEQRMRAIEERISNVVSAPANGTGGTSSAEPVVPASAPAGDPPAEAPAATGTGGEQNGGA